jgi:hypothetical protein
VHGTHLLIVGSGAGKGSYLWGPGDLAASELSRKPGQARDGHGGAGTPHEDQKACPEYGP